MLRTSGILLHPTALPGRYGIGDLGKPAFDFVDFLQDADQGLWQMLPLGPTGYGDSPYQSLSTFAGNPMLISLDKLVEDGWLRAEDLANTPAFPNERVDFGTVIPFKLAMLQLAFQRYRDTATDQQREELVSFSADHGMWLEDYALFRALKEHHGGRPWYQWELPLVQRDAKALNAARHKLATAVDFQIFLQFHFQRQWAALRGYAHSRHVRLIGDLPIFVAHDSADTWAHQEYFYLNEQGQPTVMAGVPPDYFSADGQLWGNPLYRWETMAADDYRFWVERIRRQLAMVDYIRLDHFRGFAAYWEVPGDATTAQGGQWVPGPGLDLFQVLRSRLGGLPLIAEDLGEITDDVRELRDVLELPGMGILQFAFDDADGNSEFLPHNHRQRSLIYTGTHDNDTTLGWWQSLPAATQQLVLRYLDCDSNSMPWPIIRAAWASVAMAAVAPLQDILSLGIQARFNTPGQAGGNWAWRYRAEELSPDHAARLREFGALYVRHPMHPNS